MDTPRDRVKRGFALSLTMLLLTLSIAVPLMETSEVADSTVIESEHNPAECPPSHDHTVCTQVGANYSAAAGRPTAPIAATIVAVAAATTSPEGASSPFDEGHPSRAPPLA
jgi:hypothetical protein